MGTNARRAAKTPATTARRRKQMGERASKLLKEPTGRNAAAPAAGEARTRKAPEATEGRGTSLVEAAGGGTSEAEAPATRRGRAVDHRTRRKQEKPKSGAAGGREKEVGGRKKETRRTREIKETK